MEILFYFFLKIKKIVMESGNKLQKKKQLSPEPNWRTGTAIKK
jgi:hypothetical protein